jgi:hypothetical protein
MKIRNGDTPIPLPDVVKNGDAITARWANGIRTALQRLRDRTPVAIGGGKITGKTKPPLWVTLTQVSADPIAWSVYVEYGQVVPRHNTSTDLGEPIEITGLPTFETQLTVVEGSKLWVKLTIASTGKVTTAAFESGTSWPEDLPPVLKGGDNTSGTEGARHIRIAEIIADPDSTATPPSLIRKQLLTGHIDHFQNELCENIDTTGSAVMKSWDAATGAWLFRKLVAGAGITVTQNANDIEVEATGSAGTGFWGSTTWTAYNLGGTGTLTHTYENGRLTNVAVSGDATKTGAGTEADPYSATIDLEYNDT